MRNLLVKIKRYNPERDDKPHWEEYRVEADPMDRVLDVMLNDQVVPGRDAGPRWSCAHGVCGSDAMRINGVNGLACKILVKKLESDTLTIEPILGLPVIKDLIVDMKPFFDHYKSVMPFLVNDDPPPTTERLQSPERAGPVRRHDQVHPLRLLHDRLPAVLGRPEVRRPGGDRQRPPLHLRLARPGGRRAAGDPERRRGGLAVPDRLQLHRACPRDIQVTQAIIEVQLALLTGSTEGGGTTHVVGRRPSATRRSPDGDRRGRWWDRAQRLIFGSSPPRSSARTGVSPDNLRSSLHPGGHDEQARR